jgi:FMN phosphatase YigB (HAD superfamily)
MLSDGLKNPCAPGARIRAVLFDLDGTLYRQLPMRALMALELFAAMLRNPAGARRLWRGLNEYRKAQETLRAKTTAPTAAVEQIEIASERSGLSVSELERLVDEWMLDRPLKYLPFCRARAITELLDFLDEQRIRIGVLSDYPAEAKLRALGFAGRFSPVLCTGDDEIAALKPNPRGFLAACRHWGLAPEEVLMVGDRFTIDGAGATAAGMPCVIIGGSGGSTPQVMVVPSFERLRCVLADGR